MAYTLRDILPVALLMVVAVIAVAIGANVVDDVQGDQTVDSVAYNISGYGLEGLNELGSWFPTIALVVAAAIIIGILVMSFAYGRS